MIQPNAIVWIHGDCLSPQNPALQHAKDAPALFVWDEELLAQWQISLKRIVFMYECLLELPVTIRRGNVVEELRAFADEHHASRIVTSESVSPRFRVLRQQLARTHEVEVLPVEPFVRYSGEFDLRRFARYWKVAEPLAYGAREQLKLW